MQQKRAALSQQIRISLAIIQRSQELLKRLDELLALSSLRSHPEQGRMIPADKG
jgi:hypothetical protein